MTTSAVISGASQILAHVPGLARHGSKPRRELGNDPAVERAFLRALRGTDEFGLITLDPAAADRAAAALAAHPLAKALDLDLIDRARGDAEAVAAEAGALPLHVGADRLVGAVRGAQADDESLSGHVLLENL